MSQKGTCRKVTISLNVSSLQIITRRNIHSTYNNPSSSSAHYKCKQPYSCLWSGHRVKNKQYKIKNANGIWNTLEPSRWTDPKSRYSNDVIICRCICLLIWNRALCATFPPHQKFVEPESSPFPVLI